MAFVAGAAGVQGLAALPGTGAQCLLGLLAAAGAAALRLGPRAMAPRLAGALALGLGAGVLNAAWQAEARLRDALDERHQDQVLRLPVRLAALAETDASGARVLAEPLEPRPAGVPSRIRVTWRQPEGGPPLPELVPGQMWRMTLVLRRPHGLMNPHAPDAEGRLFAAGVRALGTVRGQPRPLGFDPWASPLIAVQWARHRIRAGMREALGAHRYAPVLIALAIGDQAGVAREDWRIFNRSGITHLVSISGMHVTSIAGMAGLLTAAIWRRLRWRGTGAAEFVPSRLAGGAAAALAAWAYCLLAGWGVPARRTFFMLSAVLAAAMARLPLTAGRTLLAAAAFVTALDPWSPLAPGFWLSFGAVAVLLRVADTSAAPGAGRLRRWAAGLRQAAAMQLAITLGLTPMLAFLVHQVSLGSPLANAVAIPAVSFVVTPLALLCAALSATPGAQAAAAWAGRAGLAAFDWTMAPVAWVGTADWASVPVAAAPWPWLALAGAGAAWALQARGWPLRPLGWLCMLPMLCWRPERPEPGYWRMTALDVGQGSAILVQTARTDLLFDAGPRHYGGADAGERVVAPFLLARGVRRLDTMIVSHADMDHVGGTRAVLAEVEAAAVLASFDLARFLRRDAARWPREREPALPPLQARCRRGDRWEADGVAFSVLHPDEARARAGRGRNADSCVLHVQGEAHSLLLTGDVGMREERALAAELPASDVVLAGHHGSATSSSRELVAAAKAAHVIAQSGHLNRYGHPAPAIKRRWEAAGARFWHTDRDGAVVAESRRNGLAVWSQRERGGRYWHGR